MKILCEYTKSTIGQKTIVAVTGIMLIGFLVAHLAGNLQMFAGRGETVELTKMNAYAVLLKSNALLLWTMRMGLIAIAATHIFFTISLTRKNRAARPQSYAAKKSYATAASRTMVYGGLFLLLFIVYHLLHFTLGYAHSDLFQSHDVYQNVVDSFNVPAIAIVYILAMCTLFMHLFHGTVSLFQTLGMVNPAHLAAIKKLGLGLSILICGGFISIPVAVWIGCIS
jgi:succinate dehydrogenase / fumarate reductase cytochrome b subunit